MTTSNLNSFSPYFIWLTYHILNKWLLYRKYLDYQPTNLYITLDQTRVTVIQSIFNGHVCLTHLKREGFSPKHKIKMTSCACSPTALLSVIKDDLVSYFK